MSDYDVLDKMILPTARVNLLEEHDKKLVCLEDAENLGHEVKIRDMPPDSIVIRTDKFKSPDSFFKGERGECRRADYAIISADMKCILYIEMKTNKEQANHVENQLRGAKCVVAYCREIGRAFWQEESFLSGYKDRYISISHVADVKKGRTGRPIYGRDTPNVMHDAPERAMKIGRPGYLVFNRIARLEMD